MTAALPSPIAQRRSPFAGTNVCDAAGFGVPGGTPSAMFDDDVWDFTEVIGLPVQMPLSIRRLDFTTIVNPRWRLVAKELVFALLAPRHEAVAPLSGAYRTPLRLRTCQARLAELTSWLNWLTALGIATLAEVNEEHCQRYFAYRRQSRDKNGTVVADLGPATRVRTTLAMFDLINYRELFTSDRVDQGLPGHLAV